MPDGQTRTHRSRDLRAHTLRACAATAALASLAACSAAGTPYEGQARTARAEAPAHGLMAPPHVNRGARLARALRPILPGGDTRLAVAVLDLDNADQEIAWYGQDARFDTASIIKVGILAAQLLQAQDEDRELTAAERWNAEAMIRTSDNEATNVLWRAIGGAEGLDAANERLGLSSTQGGPGMRWGLTQTTATDQVKLFARSSPEGRWPPTARPKG
ncbi:hypothetical protein SVIOM74S_08740 [Streptomyces violarus]